MNGKKTKYRVFKLLPLFILVSLLSGCWSSVEIHDIAFINAMAVDLNKSGEYDVSILISNPSAIFSQSFIGKTGGNQQNKYLIETATGRTIFDAVGKLSHSIPEKLYFGHMDAVLFGEKVAREKMAASLDYFYRENQFRPNIRILVAKGKATDFLNNTPEFNTTLGLEILDFTKPNRYANNKKVIDISQFMKVFRRDTSDAITVVLTTSNKLGIKAKVEDQDSKNKQLKNPKVTSVDGAAVFKKGKLIGFLEQKETHGLSWIKGEMENEIIPLACGRNDEGYVSVTIRKNSSEYLPLIEEKRNSLTVSIDVEAEIGEVTCPTIDLNTEQINHLNQELANHIKKEAKVGLDKVQKKWQADVFGFGEAIYREYPIEWHEMAPNWRKGGLKDLHVTVNVNSNISRYGLRKNPS